jgi:hypothetical protein
VTSAREGPTHSKEIEGQTIFALVWKRYLRRVKHVHCTMYKVHSKFKCEYDIISMSAKPTRNLALHQQDHRRRRKMRLLKGNAKCRHLKNWPVKGLCGRYLSEAQKSLPLPLTHCIRVFGIFIHTGKGEGGRVEPERRGEEQQVRVQIKRLGWQYQHDWLHLQSINSDKYLPQSPGLYSVLVIRWRLLHCLRWFLSFYDRSGYYR